MQWLLMEGFSETVAFEGRAAAAAKSLQLCPTLCDPTDGSPRGSSVPGILQASMLEWVAISFSSACMHAKSPLPTGFSRQEYWSGLTFPSLEGRAECLEKEREGLMNVF